MIKLFKRQWRTFSRVGSLVILGQEKQLAVRNQCMHHHRKIWNMFLRKPNYASANRHSLGFKSQSSMSCLSTSGPVSASHVPDPSLKEKHLDRNIIAEDDFSRKQNSTEDDTQNDRGPTNCDNLHNKVDDYHANDTVENPLPQEDDGSHLMQSTTEGHSPVSEMVHRVDISSLTPLVPARAHDLAAYVNDSETLSNLLKIGVNLAEVQKDKDIASLLATLDFKRDVQPYLLFLLNAGVEGADMARLITGNPAVFRERMEDLEVKVNYLQSKKFSKSAIGRIFSRAPSMLSMSTVEIDKRLGFLQKEFYLKGDEIRAVVTSHPQIAVRRSNKIRGTILAFGEFMGFSREEKKQLVLAAPKLYLMNEDALIDKFDYLHNTMNLSHKAILGWPDIFRSRLYIIKQRHQFLQVLGRDQFDPKKENFVSLKALVTGTEQDFCAKIAKCDLSVFHDFLKTI